MQSKLGYYAEKLETRNNCGHFEVKGQMAHEREGVDTEFRCIFGQA